ncbi:MAG: RsmG family class I SAM-dependent methyltransferase, partial [Acidimicrobiales bacterium]
IEHARRFSAALTGPRPARALDLGSGGGLPGLVLILAWPSTVWCLLDANQRRTDFLTDAVDELGVADRVTVVRGRAEEVAHDPAHRGRFDLVVARSFGKPAVTAECAAGFLVVGGMLVVSEPPSEAASGALHDEAPDAEATRWNAEGLAQLGLEVAGVQAGCQVLRASAPCPDRYPRRVGIPAKRPLFD